jgi:AraC-like DNA-binding protein
MITLSSTCCCAPVREFKRVEGWKNFSSRLQFVGNSCDLVSFIYSTNMKPRCVNAIYSDQPDLYMVDTCEPQIRAVREGKIRLHALSKGHYPGTRIPPAVLPGLTSIGFWDGTGVQDWGLNPHRNEGVEIHFLETGKMAFTMDDRRFDLLPGHMTITRPWQLHKLGDPNIGPGRVHWLILEVGVRRPNQDWRWPPWLLLAPDDLAELKRKLRHNEMPVWQATPAIVSAFQRISECIPEWDKPHVVSRMIANLNQLFVGILDALTEQQTDENPELTSRRRTVDLFLKELADNPDSADAFRTLDEMARHCGMGITAFSKYTRQLVNAGPMEFLKQCRLDRAAQQLCEQPERSITEIGFANGFNSSQYFSTCFRHRFKVSPSKFLLNQPGFKKDRR